MFAILPRPQPCAGLRCHRPPSSSTPNQATRNLTSCQPGDEAPIAPNCLYLCTVQGFGYNRGQAMSKRDTVDTFRRRLTEQIDRSGLSRARFASRAGLSRSALSQLLLESNVRLPRAETIAQIAARHRCSADWLLGLSEQDQVAADIVPQMMIEPDAGDPAD